MKNSLKRFVPKGYLPFINKDGYLKKEPQLVNEVLTTKTNKLVNTIQDIFNQIPIVDGMCLSFHHHLRNGDYIINLVMAEVKARGLKNITIAPSSIFPIHEPLVELLEDETITSIYTNYINGPVADIVSAGALKNLLVMDTHGGRARAIQAGEIKIDVAFLAVPTADKAGNGNGFEGKSACGSLGYAIPDLLYAKHKVIITDNLVPKVPRAEIEAKYVDYVLVVNEIGDSKGIVSGTTRPTKDPIQQIIAKNTALLIEDLGLVKPGLSFQTGAGGISLLVAKHLATMMQEKQIKGSFASGGITAFLVQMLEENLFEKLYDVQCFDLEAVRSYKENPNHLPLSAITYASPYAKAIIEDLDIVILGATEIDQDFNVNVTTDSFNRIIGGSGGHSDTARASKVSIITTNLVKSRLPILKNEITTITTPGETIDCVVTERGIAINPKRVDLIEKLKDSKLNILPIEELIQTALKITGVPKEIKRSNKPVGLVRYLDGSIIDTIFKNE
ncbi:MAG: citrate lyase subunit alpha [Acholeplasmataceae bacterium]|jgi:citrate lyase subunit alpha/citrate CoA-transferase|nr:citrate lyase subunit alpha [Acholeplasmataceae bacterium]